MRDPEPTRPGLPAEPEGEEPPPAGGYRRPLPDTTSRVHVFYDQLHNRLSDRQVRFVAERADGTQKVTRNVSDRNRAINPDFRVLQCRLAFGLSTEVNIVGANDWARDTVEPDDAASPPDDPRRTEERFHLHHPANGGPRVEHGDGYFLADPRDEGWQAHHAAEILRRMPLNDFDGVFLDTAHLRLDGFRPADWYRSFCGDDPTRLDDACWDGHAVGPRAILRHRQLRSAHHRLGRGPPARSPRRRHGRAVHVDGRPPSERRLAHRGRADPAAHRQRQGLHRGELRRAPPRSGRPPVEHRELPPLQGSRVVRQLLPRGHGHGRPADLAAGVRRRPRSPDRRRARRHRGALQHRRICDGYPWRARSWPCPRSPARSSPFAGTEGPKALGPVRPPPPITLEAYSAPRASPTPSPGRGPAA